MWRVALPDDHVTGLLVTVHYLQTLCSFSFEDAVDVVRRGELHGSVDVAEVAGQAEAEQLAAAFQRRGIHATVRWV